MGTTNIDRLHNVLLGNIRSSQRIGRTYAACVSCANIVMLGEMETITWVMSRIDYIDHIVPMMCEIFTEFGLEFNRERRNEVRSGRCRIIFTSKTVKDLDFEGYSRDDMCVVEEPE